MNPQYRVVGADQREYGPVSADELRSWIAEGRVNAHSMIQAEGVPGWRPLGSDPDFAGTLLAPAPFTPQTFASFPAPRTNGLAVTGFVTALLGILLCCCGPLPSIIGLVFSSIGFAQTTRDPSQSGRGFAIAGIVLSVIGLVLSCFGILVWLAGQH